MIATPGVDEVDCHSVGLSVCVSGFTGQFLKAVTICTHHGEETQFSKKNLNLLKPCVCV